MSACESNSTFALLLATKACMKHRNSDSGQMLNETFFWLSGLTVPSRWSSRQLSAQIYLVLFHFLLRAGLFLSLASGFSSANKLSLLLLSVSTSSTPKDNRIIITVVNWWLMVDEYYGFKTFLWVQEQDGWTHLYSVHQMEWMMNILASRHFFESKNKMVEPICIQFNKWRQNKN